MVEIIRAGSCRQWCFSESTAPHDRLAGWPAIFCSVQTYCYAPYSRPMDTWTLIIYPPPRGWLSFILRFPPVSLQKHVYFCLGLARKLPTRLYGVRWHTSSTKYLCRQMLLIRYYLRHGGHGHPCSTYLY